MRFCITMVAGGAESSVFLIGNQVAAMLEMPELYQQMREDRSLVRPFLEETSVGTVQSSDFSARP